MGVFLGPHLPKGGYSWNSSLAAPTQHLSEMSYLFVWMARQSQGLCLLLPGQEDEPSLFTAEAHVQGLLWLNYHKVQVSGRVPTATPVYSKNRQPDFILPSKVTFAELSSFPSNFFFHLSHCFLWIWAKCIHDAICYSSTDNATNVLIYTDFYCAHSLNFQIFLLQNSHFHKS